eukprot:362523-Chlamydomonas_euryale.AAC.7
MLSTGACAAAAAAAQRVLRTAQAAAAAAVAGDGTDARAAALALSADVGDGGRSLTLRATAALACACACTRTRHARVFGVLSAWLRGGVRGGALRPRTRAHALWLSVLVWSFSAVRAYDAELWRDVSLMLQVGLSRRVADAAVRGGQKIAGQKC